MYRALRGLTVVAALYVLVLAVLAVWSPATVKRHHLESAAFILAAVWSAAVWTAPTSARQPLPPGGSRSRFWIACAVAALAGVASMWRAAFIGPLSDDYVIESWAAAGRLLGSGGWFVRPLVVGVWQGVLHLDGFRTLHVLNLLLHAANSVLVVALARRIGAATMAAVAAGAVFLLWPTQIEAVYWTAGMFDVLMTTCVLGALVLTAPNASPRLWVAGVACAAGALVSKETAVVLPALWVICYARRRGEESRAGMRPLFVAAALIVVCGAYFLWRAWMHLPLTGGTHLTRYVIKEQISRTFAGLALPLTADTTSVHPYFAVLLAVVFLTLLVALVWKPGDDSERTAARGLAWALVAGAPAIGLLYIGPDLEGSRYLYLPCAGLGLFVGAALTRIASAPVFVRASVVALGVAALLILAVERYRLTGQWVRAAQERDVILAAAVDAADRDACNEVVFDGLPARYRGAQLFNNGFPEAFARARRPATGARPCHFEWTGAGFQPR